jgi:LytS/YehU family sensor histidine kinase
VPLWREFDFLRAYLAVELVRFEDRLRTSLDGDPAAADALVPHMLLQPIVENAIRHGLGRSEHPVNISVRAAVEAAVLHLTVTDDGPGANGGAFDGPGIGLRNTRDRVRRLYGDRAALRAENRLPHGVRVTIQLPLHYSPAEGGEWS